MSTQGTTTAKTKRSNSKTAQASKSKTPEPAKTTKLGTKNPKAAKARAAKGARSGSKTEIVSCHWRSGSLDVDFGYTGHYAHMPTGLALTLFRAYDANLGLWLSEDPIRFRSGDLNFYTYVTNDPVGQSDPLGLQSSGTAGEAVSQAWGVGPIAAARANADAKHAAKSAQASGLPGLHNGEADAYRHCLWSCLMAQHLGVEQAKRVGDTHERLGTTNGQPSNEKAMDDANNAVGRQCAQENNGRTCEQRCLDKLYTGDLVGLGGMKPFYPKKAPADRSR